MKPAQPSKNVVTMSKPSNEPSVTPWGSSVPPEEPRVLPCADCQPENAFIFDRWEQSGEDHTRQTSSYYIHITLSGRTS